MQARSCEPFAAAAFESGFLESRRRLRSLLRKRPRGGWDGQWILRGLKVEGGAGLAWTEWQPPRPALWRAPVSLQNGCGAKKVQTCARSAFDPIRRFYDVHDKNMPVQAGLEAICHFIRRGRRCRMARHRQMARTVL